MHAPLRTSSLPQHKNTSAIVVAPRFEVYIGKQEDREDDADGVPAGKDQAVKDHVRPVHEELLREDSRECSVYHSVLAFRIEIGKGDHRWDLQQADLYSVG